MSHVDMPVCTRGNDGATFIIQIIELGEARFEFGLKLFQFI